MDIGVSTLVSMCQPSRADILPIIQTMNIRTLEIKISLGNGSESADTHFNITVPATDDAHASLAYMATDIIQEDRLSEVLRRLENELEACKKCEDDTDSAHVENAGRAGRAGRGGRAGRAGRAGRSELDAPGYLDAKQRIAQNSVDAARAAAGISAPELPLEFPPTAELATKD